MKPHQSENVTSAHSASYIQETSICDNIIAGGVILFLTGLIVIGIMLALLPSFKPEPKQRVIVHSNTKGWVEVRP